MKKTAIVASITALLICSFAILNSRDEIFGYTLPYKTFIEIGLGVAIAIGILLSLFQLAKYIDENARKHQEISSSDNKIFNESIYKEMKNFFDRSEKNSDKYVSSIESLAKNEYDILQKFVEASSAITLSTDNLFQNISSDNKKLLGFIQKSQAENLSSVKKLMENMALKQNDSYIKLKELTADSIADTSKKLEKLTELFTVMAENNNEVTSKLESQYALLTTDLKFAIEKLENGEKKWQKGVENLQQSIVSGNESLTKGIEDLSDYVDIFVKEMGEKNTQLIENQTQSLNSNTKNSLDKLIDNNIFYLDTLKAYFDEYNKTNTNSLNEIMRVTNESVTSLSFGFKSNAQVIDEMTNRYNLLLESVKVNQLEICKSSEANTQLSVNQLADTQKTLSELKICLENFTDVNTNLAQEMKKIMSETSKSQQEFLANVENREEALLSLNYDDVEMMKGLLR